MPTGVAFQDPRTQLFDAAERLLLQAGPNALTSRAVTAEAGCAKGVLHRHFADFDDFLEALVLDRIGRIAAQSAALHTAAGTGTVTGNLADALGTLFDPVAVAVVGLVTFRDELRARLRRTTPRGVPLLAEATAMLAGYLAAEQRLGRIAAEADLRPLAPTLIGAGHLLFADRESARPEPAALRQVVATVIGGALPPGRKLG